MDKLKEWIVHHKALAAGGGIAIAVLLYLWFRSAGTQQAAAPDTTGLQAYYAAQSAASSDTAAATAYNDQLQASSLATNAAETVALAQAQASATPYTDQLTAIQDELNLTAYQDFLAETAGTGNASTNANAYAGTLNSGDAAVLSTAGGWSKITDLVTGQTYFNSEQNNPNFPAGSPNVAPPGVTSAMEFAGGAGPGTGLTPVYWAGVGSQPVAPSTAGSSAPLTFAQFVGQGSTAG